MAVIASYIQQPAERLDYDVPYDVASADSVLSAVVAVESSGLTVDSIVLGNTVKLWVEGGTNGVSYKVTITTTTTLGRVKQDELKFRIKDY